MLQVPPLARNIEEASALAQYFTLVAASRNHNSAKKKTEETFELTSQKAKEPPVTSDSYVESSEKQKLDQVQESSRATDIAPQTTKGRIINLLF